MSELRTPRLRLRRARAEDLDAIHAVLSSPAAMAHWSTTPHADLETTRAWLGGMIASPPEVSEDFVVEFEGRVVGKAGFYRLPEVGYILHPDVWGRGLGIEAVAAAVDHVFATRALDLLTADVDPDNAASIRLLEALGFERTGSAQRTFQIAGQWKDSIYYGLTRARRAAVRSA